MDNSPLSMGNNCSQSKRTIRVRVRIIVRVRVRVMVSVNEQ